MGQNDTIETLSLDMDILAVNFLQYSSIEERERDDVLQETNKDKELQSLKHYISTGWPAKRSQIPVSLHPYWNFRDELTLESGILMKNSKVLIPETLKQKYLMQIHQGIEAVPSSQATSTVDAIPTVPPSKQNGNSTPRTPRQPRVSRRSTKGVPTPKAWTTEVIFHVQTFLFQKGRCCDMGQNDTIGKIELNPSFVLSSDNTNCKNDIQLFHQLFDELSVNRDYH